MRSCFTDYGFAHPFNIREAFYCSSRWKQIQKIKTGQCADSGKICSQSE